MLGKPLDLYGIVATKGEVYNWFVFSYPLILRLFRIYFQAINC
jgi:hypothetical protein